MAVQFAKLGSVLVLWDIDEQGNSDTAKIIQTNGGKAFVYTCDVSNRNEVYQTADRVKSQVGKVTILVNNAGIVTGKPLMESPDHLIEKTFAVNILAHFWTVKAFLPDMLQMKKGHIVTIASMAGYIGINKIVDYASTKSACIGFNNTLAAELRENGFPEIHTTLACPGRFSNRSGQGDSVKSRIASMEPEAVSEAIIKSVLTNSREVNVPPLMSIVITLKTILPVSVIDLLIDYTSTETSSSVMSSK